MYLIDTNVLSAGSPSRAGISSGVIDWMERNNDRLFVSVVTVAEIENGIAKAEQAGASRKAGLLATWLESLLHLYRERIISLDLAVSRILGRLLNQARASGRSPGWADLAIAATARSEGYIVLTRNLRHFRGFAVRSHDPFESLPTG